MMDMLTDRCATMCLLVNLSLLYPSYTFLFQLSMCLDIASHWLHLHRYVSLGGGTDGVPWRGRGRARGGGPDLYHPLSLNNYRSEEFR